MPDGRNMEKLENQPQLENEINDPFPHKENGTVGSESITSRVYAWLRTDIISGKFVPGRKLNIEEQRQLYSAGTSPIRAARALPASTLFSEDPRIPLR